MRKIKSFVKSALLALVLTTVPNIHAQSPNPSNNQGNKTNITVGFDTYRWDVFRGLSVPRGAVLMPWINVSRDKWNILGMTTHYTKRNNDVGPLELGSAFLAVDYTIPLKKKLSVSLGYEIFTYPTFDIKRSQAVRTSLSYENRFNPKLDAIYDFDAGRGFNAEFSSRYDVAKHLRLKGAVGYNNSYFTNGNRLGYVEGGILFPLTFKDVNIETKVSYIKGFSRDFQQGLNFGVSISKRIK